MAVDSYARQLALNAISNSGGGEVSIINLMPNYNNKIDTVTEIETWTSSATEIQWIAPQDCWINGAISSYYNGSSAPTPSLNVNIKITIDDNIVGLTYLSNINSSATTPISYFIKKGQILKIKSEDAKTMIKAWVYAYDVINGSSEGGASSKTVIYVESETQTGLYNFQKAIEDSIDKVIKSDAKDGALVSVVQPFHGGSVSLMGSGFIVDHGDEVWSGSMTFTVPTTITSINIVGAYDFQYIKNTKQLALEKKIHGYDLDKYFEYSTNEKIVGKWIDGKPIYEKIYQINKTLTTSPTQVASSIDNISYIENVIEGKILRTINNSSSYKTSCSSTVTVWKESNTSFKLYAISEINSAEYLILKYTKTTD